MQCCCHVVLLAPSLHVYRRRPSVDNYPTTVCMSIQAKSVQATERLRWSTSHTCRCRTLLDGRQAIHALGVLTSSITAPSAVRIMMKHIYLIQYRLLWGGGRLED